MKIDWQAINFELENCPYQEKGTIMNSGSKKILRTENCDCALHGRQTWAYSETCGGLVCIECVKDHLYIEDIEKKMIEDYPELF